MFELFYIQDICIPVYYIKRSVFAILVVRVFIVLFSHTAFVSFVFNTNP